MKVEDLTGSELRGRLKRGGLRVEIGPFIVRLATPLPEMQSRIGLLYAEYSVHEDDGFSDFSIQISPGGGIRRWFRPKAQFAFDGHAPFAPLPRAQAFAFFEWGLNWCIANHINVWLILHAAVLERGGLAVIMPGAPGMGKSTLSAALMAKGWRLLSDELALISLEDFHLTPVPRPISLKNESIEVIRHFAPELIIGPPAKDTAKGTVAHVRPSTQSILSASETARARWIVFPRFVPSAPARLTRRSKARTALESARNSFNYSILSESGFATLGAMLDECECYDFVYSALDEAIDVFAGLARAG